MGLCEFATTAVALPRYAVQGLIFASTLITARAVVNLLFIRAVLQVVAHWHFTRSQGTLSAEMGRERFPVEIKTFQTFGLHALLQRV